MKRNPFRKLKSGADRLLGRVWMIIWGCLPVLLAVVTLFYMRIGYIPKHMADKETPRARHYVVINADIMDEKTPQKGMLIVTYPNGEEWWSAKQHKAKEYRIVGVAGDYIPSAGLANEYKYGDNWTDEIKGKAVNSIASTDFARYGIVPSGYIAVISPDSANEIDLIYSYEIWGYAEESTFLPFLANIFKSLGYCIVHGIPYFFTNK